MTSGSNDSPPESQAYAGAFFLPMPHAELSWRAAPKRQSTANLEGETIHASLSFSALTQCADAKAKALCLGTADSLHMRNSEEPPSTALVPASA